MYARPGAQGRGGPPTGTQSFLLRTRCLLFSSTWLCFRPREQNMPVGHLTRVIHHLVDNACALRRARPKQPINRYPILALFCLVIYDSMFSNLVIHGSLCICYVVIYHSFYLLIYDSRCLRDYAGEEWSTPFQTGWPRTPLCWQ